MKTLLEKRIIVPKIADVIFSNLDKIIQVNQEFYNTFEKFYETSPIVEQFGSFFVKTVSSQVILML
jgi:hypothetical protein